MKKPVDTHENLSEHSQIKTSSDRSFGIVFTVVFLIIGFWPLVRGSLELHWWAIGLAAVLLLISVTKPGLLAALNRLWTKFGLLLHKIINPVIMGILFFLTIMPIGLIMRLFGKDMLRLKLDQGSRSYWITRDPPGPEAESMRNQF